MSFITSIGTANPQYKFHQSELADFMVRCMQLSSENERKLRAVFRMSGIDTRYSVMDDFGKQGDFHFFNNKQSFEPMPSTRQRLEVFRSQSLQLSKKAIENCLQSHPDVSLPSITHLIVVSCTGMYAPGLDIDLVHSLGLRSTVERTCINFMGCYAAFNAIKLANTFCASDAKAKVLIVCTEICSIHFQRVPTDDNFLANALFGDGSAALLVEATPRKGLNLKPVAFHCDLATDGEQDMSWTIGDLGFEMRLSAYVPEVIKNGISKLTASLLERIAFKTSDISYFAIHPGGKRILEVIEEKLDLTKTNSQASYSVLKNYGNMSSPTVLFVLREICNNLNGVDNGRKIMSFAFGPGLTLESMILEIQSD